MGGATAIWPVGLTKLAIILLIGSMGGVIFNFNFAGCEKRPNFALRNCLQNYLDYDQTKRFHIFKVNVEEQTIDIDGIKLHYRVSGSGKPLILMHGWGCNLTTVASIEKVAGETHEVYNVDFPGFGQTPEPSETWGVEQYTRLIEDFADRLGLVSPVLVGHSFGGRVAILMSSRRDVDKVILVDAAGIKPRRSIKYYLKVYSFKTAKTLANLFLPRDKAEKTIERMRGRHGSADYSQSSSRMRAILSRVVNEDLSDRLSLIKAPTLLIWGADDTATPVWMARKMEKTIPDAGLVVFDHCGHYSFLDNPVQFAAVLRSFLHSKPKPS